LSFFPRVAVSPRRRVIFFPRRVTPSPRPRVAFRPQGGGSSVVSPLSSWL